jgi:hypothetical protein
VSDVKVKWIFYDRGGAISISTLMAIGSGLNPKTNGQTENETESAEMSNMTNNILIDTLSR